MVAQTAVEEEEGDEEESDEPGFAAAPEAGPQNPERLDRRDRRGRRNTPPPRGGGRMRTRTQSRALPLISELLKEGQEILVQIAKEPIGKKGARITSHIARPGRFLVYMPTVNHIGVSRKISSEEERQRLKRIVSSERENGHGGFIVRTAASNIKEDELRADIRFLKHLWNEIRTRAESSKSPALIYHDLNLVERILRDQVTSDFSQIWVDNESEYERVVRFASRFQPSLVRRIKLYSKDTPLYEQFGINEEINKSLKSKVWLKSGGYIVINQTEALVAIDINTGKYVGKTARLEDTIVKTNCDAVKEIVRQIRLRDLGGIIVVDFIDMDERKNRQKVMQALEEAMKADRAPSKILQFNDFGLVAITRKRVKQSLERTLGTPCPYCDATGFVKSVQTICNEIYVEMRKVRRHVESKEVILRVNPEVARELKGGNGKWLQEMEELLGHPVLVKSDAQLHQEKFDMNY
jgi:ribonuclease G